MVNVQISSHDSLKQAIFRGEYSAALIILTKLARTEGHDFEWYRVLLNRFEGGRDRILEWTRLSADLGNADDQLALGTYYYYGDEHLKESNIEALKWCSLAAAAGKATAQRILGEIYRYGHGVEVDYAEALKWFLLASAQDDTASMREIGRMYIDGLGVEENRPYAVHWLEQSANQGDVLGQYHLAKEYLRQGTIKSRLLASKWCQMAAKSGLVNAQCLLGAMYKEGTGVEKSLPKAFYWHKLSAKRGSEESLAALEELAEIMSDREFAEGYALLEDQ